MAGLSHSTLSLARPRRTGHARTWPTRRARTHRPSTRALVANTSNLITVARNTTGQCSAYADQVHASPTLCCVRRGAAIGPPCSLARVCVRPCVRCAQVAGLAGKLKEALRNDAMDECTRALVESV